MYLKSKHCSRNVQFTGSLCKLLFEHYALSKLVDSKLCMIVTLFYLDRARTIHTDVVSMLERRMLHEVELTVVDQCQMFALQT
jgi:hypothetical protein